MWHEGTTYGSHGRSGGSNFTGDHVRRDSTIKMVQLCSTLHMHGSQTFCNSVCAAEFTLQPEDVVAGAGDMAMMRCEYTSTSGTEVAQWDFEGTAIFAEDPPCGCSIEEDGTLHFSNITADDAGEYTCVVQSGFNTFRCSATLRLEGETVTVCRAFMAVQGSELCGYVVTPKRSSSLIKHYPRLWCGCTLCFLCCLNWPCLIKVALLLKCVYGVTRHWVGKSSAC